MHTWSLCTDLNKTSLKAMTNKIQAKEINMAAGDFKTSLNGMLSKKTDVTWKFLGYICLISQNNSIILKGFRFYLPKSSSVLQYLILTLCSCIQFLNFETNTSYLEEKWRKFVSQIKPLIKIFFTVPLLKVLILHYFWN